MTSTRPLQRFRPRPQYPSPIATRVNAVSQARSTIAPGADARPPITTAGRAMPASRLSVLLLKARLTTAVPFPDRARRVAAYALGRLVIAASATAPKKIRETCRETPRAQAAVHI